MIGRTWPDARPFGVVGGGGAVGGGGGGQVAGAELFVATALCVEVEA